MNCLNWSRAESAEAVFDWSLAAKTSALAPRFAWGMEPAGGCVACIGCCARATRRPDSVLRLAASAAHKIRHGLPTFTVAFVHPLRKMSNGKKVPDDEGGASGQYPHPAGRRVRSAGFQTGCVAGFPVGRAWPLGSDCGFRNPRSSRLGSLRYGGTGKIRPSARPVDRILALYSLDTF